MNKKKNARWKLKTLSDTAQQSKMEWIWKKKKAFENEMKIGRFEQRNSRARELNTHTYTHTHTRWREKKKKKSHTSMERNKNQCQRKKRISNQLNDYFLLRIKFVEREMNRFRVCLFWFSSFETFGSLFGVVVFAFSMVFVFLSCYFVQILLMQLQMIHRQNINHNNMQHNN